MSEISINPPKGYSGVTSFTFLNPDVQNSNVTGVYWSFGDGGTSTDLVPSHTYYIPGKYTVTLDIFHSGGTVTHTQQVGINVYMNESIYFDFVPPPTFAGHLNRYPFKVNITSSSAGPHYIDLGAQFSRSYKSQNPQNKWSFLRPEWRFLDLSGNRIESIQTIDTPIYINGYGAIQESSLFAGVTGTAEFYFVDDIYNFDLAATRVPYTTLIATLQTSAIQSFEEGNSVPSHSNSKAVASCPHIFLWRTPENVKITENGLRDFSNPRWNGITNNIVVATDFGSKQYPDDWIEGNGVTIASPSDFFIHNYPFNTDTISFEVSSSLFDINGNFVWQDATGYKTPGYYKGSFTTPLSDANGVVISGGTTIPLPNMTQNYFDPILWISNPAAGMMATTQYISRGDFPAVINSDMGKAQTFGFNVPIINQADFTNNAMSLTGFHGINSIAALPAPNFHAWAADSETNFLYRFSTTGQILCAVDINKVVSQNNLGFLVPNQVSPASIALDSNRNIWMSLHDSVSTLKFDSIGNFLFATTPFLSSQYFYPPNIIPEWFGEDSYYDSTHYPPISGGDNNYVEPCGIDTDVNDNVWVTYSSFASGYMVKYNPNGQILNTLSFPLCSCPQEVVIDKDSNVWVVLADTIWGGPSYIKKYDTNGSLLDTIGPYRGINHLTLDAYQNIWFTYGYNWVGFISLYNSVQTLQIGGSDITSGMPDWFNPNNNTDETALEGIATDLRGFVYVINSVENQIYILNYTSYWAQVVDRYYINPQGFVYVMDDQGAPTRLYYNIWSKSAQAQGDWSGFRWINKYNSRLPYYNTTSVSITGNTRALDFYNSNPRDIFKINENHDLSKQMQAVAFQPSLVNSPTLFDNFLGPIFGQYPFDGEDIGVKAYEKIANFVPNTADADYCDIDQLYNLSEMVDMDFDDFKLSYPSVIKRILNFASINQSKLWGSELLNQNNFKTPSSNGTLNRGKLISSTFYAVSAGTPVVLKNKSINKYELIPTGPINNSNFYTINDLAHFLGLPDYNWPEFYEFYEFNPSVDGTQIGGLIDWSNPQTTLSKNLSSGVEWMGNEGTLETLFNYNLYKGLGLLG